MNEAAEAKGCRRCQYAEKEISSKYPYLPILPIGVLKKITPATIVKIINKKLKIRSSTAPFRYPMLCSR
jgi:hypothetical protein